MSGHGQPHSTSKIERCRALLTAKLPNAALAARCTSVSWLLSKNKMGSSVSRPTERTSFSVISAKARAALRCRSTLSENDRVVSAERGDPVKKLVVVRSTYQYQYVCADFWCIRNTNSQGIEANLQRPLARFPEAKVHTIATCASGL
jgi:hypothetical protein